MRVRHLLFVLVLFGCEHSEQGIDPDQSSTFLRYYFLGTGCYPTSFGLRNDGSIILSIARIVQYSTYDYPDTNASVVGADVFGNARSTVIFPNWNDPNYDDPNYDPNGYYHYGYVPSAVAITSEDDVVMVGTAVSSSQAINSNVDSLVDHIRLIGQEGNGDPILLGEYYPDVFGLDNSTVIRGVGIAIDPVSGNFIISGLKDTNGIILAEVDRLSSEVIWSRTFETPFDTGGEGSILLKNLMVDSEGNIILSRTKEVGDLSMQQLSTEVLELSKNDPIPSTRLIIDGFYAHSMKGIEDGFVMAGKSKELNGVVTISTVVKLDKALSATYSTFTFPFSSTYIENGNPNNEPEISFQTAKSICLARDGAFVMVGDIYSSEGGRGDLDVWIHKFTISNGEPSTVWSRMYGSIYEDRMMDIVQANDGGYLVVGTRSIGYRASASLLKVGPNGEF